MTWLESLTRRNAVLNTSNPLDGHIYDIALRTLIGDITPLVYQKYAEIEGEVNALR